MIAPSIVRTCEDISSPSSEEMKKYPSSPHVTGYTPAGVSAGTVNVSEITLAPFAAPTPAPFLSANAYWNVFGFVTIFAPYASEPVAPLNTIGASALLMMNCAPPIGRFTFLESLTSTSTVTSSPGLASTVWIAQMIAPSGAVTVVVVVSTAFVVVSGALVVVVSAAFVVVSGALVVVVSAAFVVVSGALVVVVSSSMMIAPLRSLMEASAFLASSVMMDVISLPFVSETKIFPPQVTGYVPAGVLAGTVYLSWRTTLPSLASTGTPLTLPNAN